MAIGEKGESSISLGTQVELSDDRELGAAELENTIRQGPLMQGSSCDCGRSDRSVGASRCFDLYSIEDDDTVKVRPVDAYTKQLYTRRGRKRAETWLMQCLEE